MLLSTASTRYLMRIKTSLYLSSLIYGLIEIKLKTLRLFSLLFLLWLGSEASAQILVGPVAGGNLNWIRFDNNDNKELYSVKPVIGFHVGGSIAFRVRKRFFLQTSILYSQKGRELVGKEDPLFRDIVKYNYIDIPMLYTAEFKAKLGKEKEFKWYLGAGPTISYWLGGKGVMKNSDLNENLINELDYKITFNKSSANVKENEMNVADANRLQLGLNISTGIIFEPLGMNKFMLTTRYFLGHSFLSADSKGVFGSKAMFYQDDLRVQNQEFSVSLHYFIDLKTDERNKGKSTSKIKTGRRKR